MGKEEGELSRRVLLVRRSDGTTVTEQQINSTTGSLEDMSSIGSPTVGTPEERFILNKIREGSSKMVYSLRDTDSTAIKKICEKAGSLFEKEARAVDIKSPVHVFGDIHGQIRDLMWFEKAFWPRAPSVATSRFVLLGDFVDRGDYGLQVVLYLFIMKIWAPKTFFLVRGNHEVREVQKMFTFHKECTRNLGPKEGDSVWEAVNQVFDRLPLAVYIDNKIFCAHGGIPCSTTSKSEILKIPCPLKDPNKESAIAWQMMWNDPLDDEPYRLQLKKFGPSIITKEFDSSLFVLNNRRNTGFYFSHRAAKRFMAAHNPPIRTIIRAHETPQLGFGFAHDKRTITIFSASDYMRKNNCAAVLLVTEDNVQAIQIQQPTKQ